MNLSAIGFSSSWPKSSEAAAAVRDKIHFADAYRRSAQELFHQPTNFFHYSGPVLQLTGLTVELTLKCVLEGDGQSADDLKNLGHETSEAIRRAKSNFDENALNSSIGKVASIPTANFQVECQTLDKLYDRPYRSRYLSQGASELPRFEVLTTGASILLQAMSKRLE